MRKVYINYIVMILVLLLFMTYWEFMRLNDPDSEPPSTHNLQKEKQHGGEVRETVVVELSEGRVSGEKVILESDEASANGHGRIIYQFLKIPYGQPPVGHLRFKVCTPLSLSRQII